MTISTKDLRKLLVVSTPGPWRVDGDPWNRIVWTFPENRVCFMSHSNGLDDARDIATSELVAASPALAAELLAARAKIEAAEKLAEAAAPYVSIVQNADYARQLRQHDALAAALAAWESLK